MHIATYKSKYLVYSRVLIHAVAALQFWYSVYYDWFNVKVPKEVSPVMSAYGGKLKFLTFWNAILLAVYFSICFINDIVGNTEPGNKSTLCYIKDYTFATLAFPIAMFVGTTFWVLMAVDRELVLPQVLDAYFPQWLNHIMHTNIMVFILIELVASFRLYPERKACIVGLVLFEFVYLAWMHFVYYKSGYWVYPVFSVLNIPQRIVFLAASISAACLFYFVGEKLNNFLWGGSGTCPTHMRQD